MKKRVIFAISISLLLFIFVTYSLFVSDDDNAIRDYGKQVVESYSDKVKDRIGEELEKLFNDLDENHDGKLTLEEFKDRRLAVAAAMNAARHSFEQSMPVISLPRTTRANVGQFLFSWFQYQVLFLLLFVVIENVQYMLINPNPRQLKLDNGYEFANPPKVDVPSALKYDTPMTLYERIKMVFFICSGIVLLRVVIIAVSFFLAMIFINLSVAGGRSKKKNPKWFNFFEQLVQLCGNLVLFGMGFYCVRIYGQPAESKDAKILIGNHVCVLEVIVLWLNAHLPSFVSRVENLSVPMFRGLATATNSILVNRETGDSRQQTLDEIKRRARNPEAEQLMLFPEGTTTSNSALFLFKRGAFEPGEPVQMAAFAYPHTHFNCCWSGRATGGNDFADMLLRMLCQFVNHAEVRFLPVYYPTEEEKQDSILYAAHCQKMMAYALQLPISDATFDDYKKAEKAYARRKHEEERFVYLDPSVASPPASPASSASAVSALAAASEKQQEQEEEQNHPHRD